MNEHDSASHESLIDKAKEASLRYAGIGYLVGDGAVLARGVATGNKGLMATGVAWGSGGIGLALFGKKAPTYLNKELALDLAKHLETSGVTIPEDSAVKQDYLSRNSGLFDKVQKFFYDHPTEILNTVYAIGALAMIKGGLKTTQTIKGVTTPRARDGGDIFSGALVLGGALSGLLIKEKKLGENEDGTPKKPENLMEWIREKPLRISGTLYTVNSIPTFFKAIGEHRADIANKAAGSGIAGKTYLLKYAQVGAFLGANALLSMSNKKRDEALPTEVLEQFTANATDIIRKQPDNMHTKSLDSIAEFMASNNSFSMDKTQALAHLEKSLGNRTVPAAKVQAATREGAVDAAPALAHSA